MNLESLRLWSLLKKASVFIFAFLLVSLALEVQSYLAASGTRDVALVWSRPPEQDVAGYRVYYGPVSRYDEGYDGYMYVEDLRPGDYEERDAKLHYVLNSLDENLAYWVAVTAYDYDENESAYSNEKKIAEVSRAPTVESSSGGCQTAPGSEGGRADARASLTGWIFFCLFVPAWILRLRKKLPESSGIS